MLKTATIKPYYTTGENEPRDLFLTGLMNSQEFDLGLGYFRSTGFGVLAIGFADFISRGGKMRFLINNTLYHKDKDAILRGMGKPPEDLVEGDLLEDLDELKKTLKKRDEHFFNCLSWMISNETLEIKAVKPAKNKRGIVHYKMGYFTDSERNKLVFLGSVNFSQYALQNNVEALFTELSWDPSPRVKEKISDVKNTLSTAWDGTSDVIVHIPMEEIKAAIVKKFPVKGENELIDAEIELIKDLLADPYTSGESKKTLETLVNRLGTEKTRRAAQRSKGTKIKLRPYQEEAISNWKKNDYKGMLEMATGTGKTFTALAAIKKLLDEKKRLQIIISCPFIHLAEQWVEEAKKFGFDNTILIGDSLDLWANKATYESQLFNRKKRDNVVFITTNASFKSDVFQKIIAPSIKNTLLVIDEAHYAGAFSIRKLLPESIPYRLGLSATPERYGDDEGTQFLKEYFDKVVYSLPLSDAIGKHLCPYRYHPIPVEMDNEEFKEYIKLTQEIGRLMGRNDEKSLETASKKAIARARVLNNCQSKLDWLRNELTNKPKNYAIFYGGDRIFQPIKQILAHQHNIRLHEFTSRQSRKERKTLLESFGSGDIQALVAMKCLDEGVDVPPTRVAYFLASSGNPREFVQRRGRVLRKYEGKDEAIIYDLIAIPPMKYIDEGTKGDNYNAVKSAFEREYARVREFAELAVNKYTALEKLFDIANKLDLTHL